MKLIKSFAYAWAGIRSCFQSEPNFRIHSVLGIVVLVFSMVFNISTIEWMAVCFCIAFVITMEMLNTALEKLCDVIHKEVHPGIKNVKDMAAGAVLVAALFSLITGAIIFIPKIISFIQSI
ncbi:MAG: diacylglycerol kinase family protein [Ferruginibacter sp.]|nr:diacylglycerol kinase family protein [Chitinophagaceae bacterium]